MHQDLTPQELVLAVLMAAMDRRFRMEQSASGETIASECLYLLHDPRLAPTLIWLDNDRPPQLDEEQMALSEEAKALFRRLARVVEELTL